MQILSQSNLIPLQQLSLQWRVNKLFNNLKLDKMIVADHRQRVPA